MTKRECEYISLSRDTTETDLKQRREIRSGTAYYIDQVGRDISVTEFMHLVETMVHAVRNYHITNLHHSPSFK